MADSFPMFVQCALHGKNESNAETATRFLGYSLNDLSEVPIWYIVLLDKRILQLISIKK